MRGRDVRQLRELAGVRQITLADELHWQPQTLIDLEKERWGPDEATAERISTAIEKLTQPTPATAAA